MDENKEKVQNAQAENAQKEQTQEEIGAFIKVKRQKLADLQEAGKDPFVVMKYDVTHHSEEIKSGFDALNGTEVSVAGRLMSKRIMGKASFANIQDKLGKIQSYVKRDDVGEESYADFKKYDIGDIVGLKGEVFTTKMGEISINEYYVVLL